MNNEISYITNYEPIMPTIDSIISSSDQVVTNNSAYKCTHGSIGDVMGAMGN